MTKQRVQTTHLSYIPGGNENSTQGGSALNSGIFEMFHGVDSFTVSYDLRGIFPDEIGWTLDRFSTTDVDVLKVKPKPIFDAWLTADGIEGEYDSLSEMQQADLPDSNSEFDTLDSDNYAPKLEEKPNTAFKRYRTAAQTVIEFESPDGVTIDESTIKPSKSAANPAQLTQYSAPTVLEQEDINAIAKDRLDSYDKDDGAYKKRHYDWVHHKENNEHGLIDGKEAIRLGTIWGGYSTLEQEIMQEVRKNGVVDTLFNLFGWEANIPLADIPESVLTGPLKSIEVGIEDFLAALPIIYNWTEVTLMADGGYIVRLIDASPFPQHVMYTEEQKRAKTHLDYQTTNYDLNVQAGLFQVQAATGGTPYTATPEEYRELVETTYRTNDIDQATKERLKSSLRAIPTVASDITFDSVNKFYENYPLWQYGEAADGTPLTDSEINSMLPEHGLYPRGEGTAEVKISDMDTEKGADFTL